MMPAKREASGILEDEIKYCEELIEVVEKEGIIKQIPKVKEKLNLLKEMVEDNNYHLGMSKDKDARVGHKTADTSFFGYKTHIAMTDERIVTAAIVTSGEKHDGKQLKELIDKSEKAGLEIDALVPTTLAERNLVLDNNELNDNIMLLDIGAGTTDIGVFEGNKFIYTNTIPLGGDNITSDISIVLNISKEEANKLKKQYGLALKSFIDNDNEIILNTCRDENKSKAIKSSELIEIIEARIEEIFSIVNKDITNQGIKSRINNVILTGQGISNINKSDVAGKIILNIPVKISTGRLISTVKPH